MIKSKVFTMAFNNGTFSLQAVLCSHFALSPFAPASLFTFANRAHRQPRQCGTFEATTSINTTCTWFSSYRLSGMGPSKENKFSRLTKTTLSVFL